jgi:hypothetical protein
VPKIAHAGSSPSEVEVATDLLAGLLIEQASASSPTTPQGRQPAAKVYAVMALTSMLTFATLVTGYQLLFSHHLFA